MDPEEKRKLESDAARAGLSAAEFTRRAVRDDDPGHEEGGEEIDAEVLEAMLATYRKALAEASDALDRAHAAVRSVLAQTGGGDGGTR